MTDQGHEAFPGATSEASDEGGARAVIADRESFLAAVFDHSLSAIVVADDDGNYVAANSAAAALLGRDRDGLEGFNIADLEVVGGPAAERRYERFLEGDREVGEIAFRRPDGEVRVAEYRAVRVRPGFNLSVLDDVTDRRRLADAERRVETLEALGVLAGGIAHDFNNLLTAVANDLSLLAGETSLAPEGQELVDEAREATRRAAGLAHQLLTFAEGGAPVRRAADLAEIVRRTAMQTTRGSRSRLDLRVSSGLWPVELDAGQIGQVIQNLVLNAAQAMPGGGVVEVEVRNARDAATTPPVPSGRYVTVSVRDRGPGIPAEVLPRIFDPYFTTKDDGRGLGLAMCHSIARRHGGGLTVESIEGEGATFTLVLPASDSSVPSRPPETRSPPRVRGAGRRALLVDDEPLVLNTLRRVLVRLGFEVVTCATGEEAIARFREVAGGDDAFDVVLTDLSIPGGAGGEEVARQIRSIDPAARVCVVTGYADDPVVARPREHGFDAALRKPFEIDSLSAALARLLGEPG